MACRTSIRPGSVRPASMRASSVVQSAGFVGYATSRYFFQFFRRPRTMTMAICT